MAANQPSNDPLASAPSGTKESNEYKGVVNESMAIIGDDTIEGSSAAAFRPTRRRESPPPFLLKIYDMVHDPRTDSIISWNTEGTSFIIHDPHRFAAEILNNYFRHNNFSSFVCQLNTYYFKKISWDKLEFRHECFQREKKPLLTHIRRRNQNHIKLQRNRVAYAAADLDISGQCKEFEELRRERDILMTEIKELKELHENAEEKLDVLKKRAECSLSKLEKMEKFMELNGSSQIAEKCRLEGAETETGSAIEDLQIELEVLIDGPADWKEYTKELLGKA